MSTADQQLGRQTDALAAAGYDRLFTDHGVSGTKPAQERPSMAALLEFARAGDTVVVVSIDRLGRSTRDVLELLATLKARSIELHVLNLGRLEGVFADLLVTILVSVAQLERDQLSIRTREGIEAARLRGSQPGRPRSLTASQQKLALELHRAGRPTGEIAEVLGGCSRRTVQRAIVAAKAAQ